MCPNYDASDLNNMIDVIECDRDGRTTTRDMVSAAVIPLSGEHIVPPKEQTEVALYFNPSI